MSLKIKKPDDPFDEFSEDEIAHMQQFGHYYEPGVLDYDKHWRLVQNIAVYAEQANIPEHYIYHSAVDILTPEQQKYLSGFFKNPGIGIWGAIITDDDAYVEKMYTMIGVMLRNYIAARYITLQDLITALKQKDPPRERMVCIPNFALPKDEGGDIASWERAEVYGWALNARSHNQQLVLYADSIQEIGKQYNGAFRQHVENHYVEFE